MSRADGFHPMRQSSGQPLGARPESMDYLEEPIVLDHQDEPATSKKRRKLLGKQKKHHSRRRRAAKKLLTVIAILIVAGLGAMAYKFYDTQRNILAGGGRAPAICNGEVPVDQLKREGDGRVNVLLVGIGGAEQPRGPDLTDTLIIASIDPVTNKAELLSIPRDLWVRIPGNGARKINEAYFHGIEESSAQSLEQQQRDGLALLEKTVQPIIGVPIHYYVLLDYAAFRGAVNAVGGVDAYVPEKLAVSERLWDDGTGRHYNLNVSEGQQNFDGTKALFFSRSRKTSVGGDFTRAERQRLMLVALKDKVLSAGTFANPVAVVGLLDSLGDNIYTNFDTGSIKCLYTQLSQIPSNEIKSLDLATPPDDLLVGGSIGNSSIQRPKEGLFEYADLHAFIRKKLPDGFLARENSPVAVYNATDKEGVATAQADLLKSYGYNVTTVDSISTSNPSRTIVVDLSGGDDKYTRNYLQKRYGVVAVEKMPEGAGATLPVGTRFVVILGNDVARAVDTGP